VWNKQRKDEVLVDVDDVALGHVTKMRWNDADQWITSAEPTHEPLVSREHPRKVYVKEEAVVPGLDRWLSQLFDDDHIDDTRERLAGSSEPDPAAERNKPRYAPRSPTATGSSPTTARSSTTTTP
jgi:hypothetical protein